MSDEIIKEALAYDLAEKLHDDWCEQELRSFFERAQETYKRFRNFRVAMGYGCFKDKKLRNEISIDSERLKESNIDTSTILENFDIFKDLVSKGIIVVKRYTKRTLTPEEITAAGDNYKNGTENILRDFSSISAHSKKDNLDSARCVIKLVYDKVMAGGQISPEEMEQIASMLHDDWLKRNEWVYNPEYGNPKLAVPYGELSQDEKEKDIAQIEPAVRKVQDYKDGIIDINAICEKYNIESSKKEY